MQPTLFDPGDGEPLSSPGPAPSAVTLGDARPYQKLWRTAVFDRWKAAQRCLGVAATGTGKTLAVALIAHDVIGGALRSVVPGCDPAVLFVNQRVDLVEQSAKEFASLLPAAHVGVEQGERTARGAESVVSACAQSLSERRLRSWGPDRFSAVVFDEAHRYGPGNVYMTRILKAFNPAVRVLGVTATPDRTDGKIGSVFHDVAFDYGIWDAVEDGWLVRPYMAYEISGAVRLDGIPTDDEGDFSGEALADRMCEAAPVAAVVAAAIKWSNYANGKDSRRPTVICCASVLHARLVALALNEWHKKAGTGPAGAVVGDMDDGVRAAVMNGFRRGEIQYVTHFDVLTEGFDSDRPKVLINGRPTKCRWVFAQNGGRVLRPLRDVARALGTLPDAAARRAMIAASSKPGAMLVDVAGVDHKLTVSLADVFRPPGATPADVAKVRDKAKRRAGDGLPSDPAADYEQLKRDRDDEFAAKWAGVLIDADLTTTMTDPFDVFSVTAGREPPWVRGRRPTDKMKAALLNAGIPRVDVDRFTYWGAKAMLDVVFGRRAAGLCSYKQARLLRDFGIDANQMSFDEAAAEIDSLASAGWPGRVGGRAAGRESRRGR